MADSIKITDPIEAKRVLLRKRQAKAGGKKTASIKDKVTGFTLKTTPLIRVTQVEAVENAKAMGCVLTEKKDLADSPNKENTQTSNHLPGDDGRLAAEGFFLDEKEALAELEREEAADIPTPEGKKGPKHKNEGKETQA